MEILLVYWLITMATSSTEATMSEIERNGELREYCDREPFVADCGDRGVIVMDKAIYGRMALGRCLQTGFGELACDRDVLQHMDDRCSGRNRCHIRNVVDELYIHNPCTYKDLEVYLQASFHCVSVSTPKELCTADKMAHISLDGTSLSSRHLHHPHCFSEEEEDNTFHLTASPGQQLNISLVDFRSSNAINHGGHFCDEYGEIEDEQTKQVTTICGAVERHKWLMVSNSHKVKIKLKKSVVEQHNFIVKLRAFGCPDLEPPTNAWIERQGDKALIGCHPGKARWELVCKEDKWVGIVGNCSSEDALSAALGRGQDREDALLPTDVTVALIASVATVACLTIITIGIILWKRYTVDNRIKRMQATQRIQIITDTDSLQRSSPQTTFKPKSPPKRPPRTPLPNFDNGHPNNGYMSPLYLGNEQKDGENAIYDFCFASPGLQQQQLPPLPDLRPYPEKALPDIPNIIPTTDYASADAALPDLANIPTTNYAHADDATLPLPVRAIEKSKKNDLNTTALYATPTKKKDRKPPPPPKAKDKVPRA